MNALSALLHSDWFKAVFSVLIGFVTAQLSGYVAERRERKKAIALALSDLLEIRHRVLGMEELVKQIGGLKKEISEQEKSHLRVIFTSLMPKWEELHERYDHAVTAVAGLDPLLAFELRSKDFILPTLSSMYGVMAQDQKAAAIAGPIVDSKLTGNVTPILDKALLGLARRRGLLCWYRTWRLVRKRSVATAQMSELIESFKTAMEAQAPAQDQYQNKVKA